MRDEARHAADVIRKFLAAGPSRASQLESQVRDAYRSFALCLQTVTPREAITKLEQISERFCNEQINNHAN